MITYSARLVIGIELHELIKYRTEIITTIKYNENTGQPYPQETIVKYTMVGNKEFKDTNIRDIAEELGWDSWDKGEIGMHGLNCDSEDQIVGIIVDETDYNTSMVEISDENLQKYEAKIKEELSGLGYVGPIKKFLVCYYS